MSNAACHNTQNTIEEIFRRKMDKNLPESERIHRFKCRTCVGRSFGCMCGMCGSKGRGSAWGALCSPANCAHVRSEAIPACGLTSLHGRTGCYTYQQQHSTRVCTFTWCTVLWCISCTCTVHCPILYTGPDDMSFDFLFFFICIFINYLFVCPVPFVIFLDFI